MSEQDCAGRKALKIAEEFIAAEADARAASFLPDPTKYERGYLDEADFALAAVRRALAVPCEHAAEDQISEGRRDALLQKADELRAEWQRKSRNRRSNDEQDAMEI